MPDKPNLPDILAYRDGAPLTKALRRAIRENPESLLALADARLLALALRIGFSKQPRETTADEEELLTYLQADEALEEAEAFTDRISGSAGILARLLALRDALDPEVSEAFPHVEPPESEMPRLDLGTVWWRSEGGTLWFSHPSIARIGGLSKSMSPTIHARSSFDLHVSLDAISPERGQGRVEARLERIDELEQTLGQTRELLERYREALLNSRERTIRSGKALMALEDDVRRVANRLGRLAVKSSARVGRQRPSRVATEKIHHTIAASLIGPKELPWTQYYSKPPGDFVESLTLDAGSGAIVLSGSVKDVDQLSVSVLDTSGQPWPHALVTMVEEGKGFQSAEVNPSGAAIFELKRRSQPKLMIETDLTLEIRLRHE